jgi:hypothetical protein
MDWYWHAIWIEYRGDQATCEPIQYQTLMAV